MIQKDQQKNTIKGAISRLKHLLSRLPRTTLLAILLLPLLFLTDALCYQITLPVEIVEQHGTITLTVGGTRLAVGTFAQPQSLQFGTQNPLVHAYQVDGSDSVYNRDLDISYFQQIADSPYYGFQAWMRDLDGTSRWRDLALSADGRMLTSITWPGNGARITLPKTTSLQISAQIQRPETPLTLNLALRDGTTLQITLDRDNRRITVSQIDQGFSQTVSSAFFPADTAPFAAMVVDTLARILLWALFLLLEIPRIFLTSSCMAGAGWLTGLCDLDCARGIRGSAAYLR
jgi:hypothetical protein